MAGPSNDSSHPHAPAQKEQQSDEAMADAPAHTEDEAALLQEDAKETLLDVSKALNAFASEGSTDNLQAFVAQFQWVQDASGVDGGVAIRYAQVLDAHLIMGEDLAREGHDYDSD